MKNRTIIGIVCMILAVAMIFAIAPVVNRLTSDTTTVVRLKQKVGRGTKITEDQVETVKVKTDTMPQGVYVKTADVVGKYASSTLYAGDILTKAKLSGDSNNADDVLATLNGSKVSDFIFGLIRAIGLIMLGFGIVQVGLSLKSHDPSQRANGFLTVAGGIVITFAKEILNLITG